VGRGDEVFPLDDRADYFLVLVVPDLFISTAEAYSWLTVQGKPSNIEGFRAQFHPGHEADQEANDFEKPIFARYAELADIKQRLLDLGAYKAALSGSGSTIYGQFRHEKNASAAASALSKRFRVKLTNPLSRSDYFQRMFL
jgi:4-diphosphocytidyl-2-C-methyl-D-erythritol kinase